MIELLCTLTGIIAGIAVVASLMHGQGVRSREQAETDDTDSERIRGIADQLQVISHRVAADVSAHSEKVENISDRLAVPDDPPEKILSTINEIISANQEMQGQLADAQKRIAQQSRMIEQASQQARTDALTGLANRRALDEFLGRSLANGSTAVVGLLLMDIDHFKNFNDSFGHTTGDAVLGSFAKSIMNCCGEECYAARFGGEEFAVILSGKTARQVARMAAELRYYVSEQVISYEDLELKITSSGGLSMLLPGDTIGTAYERADEGLYQSKKAGRNCGHWLSDEGWQPFPKVGEEPRTLLELRDVLVELEQEPVAAPRAAIQEQVAPATDVVAKSEESEVAAAARAAKPVESGSPSKVAKKKTPQGDSSEVLDLSDFFERIDSYLGQLRKANLPATAVMLEASALKRLEGDEGAGRWEETVSRVQNKLRSIDVVCLYRPFTLCVFMPGCSLDAAVDRAGIIKSVVREESEDGEPTGRLSEQLSVAVASIGPNEEKAAFLDRLENALEEAADAAPSELVVHTGEACHFQQV